MWKNFLLILLDVTTAFFDTRFGSKTETESYRKIADSLTCNPCNVLFISDTMKEVKAAHEAGMQAILCDRDLEVSQSPYMVIIRSFDEVFLG
jgi:enolase-phosphatase E1